MGTQQLPGLYFTLPWSPASTISLRSSLWTDSLMIPVYSAVISGVWLVVHLSLSRLSKNLKSTRHEYAREMEYATTSIPERRPRNAGLAFGLARLIACLALLGLTFTSSLYRKRDEDDTRNPLSEADWLNIVSISTFVSAFYPSSQSSKFNLIHPQFYVSLLALASLRVTLRWNKYLQRHLTFVLLAVFSVYSYRDIYPLATFTLSPCDLSDGWLLWIKIVLLGIVALVLPLVEPRQYVPVDPLNPMPVPNPEQEASVLSLVLYFFLDQVIFLAYSLSQLPHEMLPPLADYDYAHYLKTRMLQHMDVFSGAKRRHIFFGIMRVFRVEYAILALTTATQVVANFLSPVGVNRLLNYMETNGKDATYRPWIWILWLFLGPTIRSVTNHWYVFIVTRTLVRVEAIITQLIFEHALRIRFKSETSTDPGKGATPNPRASQNLVGKLNNLVTSDLQNITEAKDFMLLFVNLPIQLVLCIWFLYAVLGWSAFVGLAAILLMLPIPGYVGKWVATVQRELSKKTDSRMQTVIETMNLLRMIKLFAWQRKTGEEVDAKREIELSVLWKRRLVDMVHAIMNQVIPIITMVATFATYTILMKQELNASKVFSSITVFDMLRSSLQLVFLSITQLMTGKVSLDRVDDFLRNTELLDQHSESTSEVALLGCPDPNSIIGFHECHFTWSDTSDHDGVSTPGGRDFVLHIDHLVFQRGCLNLILGPTAVGKTSILMALLGEMHFVPSSPNSWFNLPRGGGIAYAAQESWVTNQTIRSNITFGATQYDEGRYAKVIHQCCLERDLELFAAGDNTEVGERGQNLSGGQKARISLARALFSTAEIVLLDDVFAALERLTPFSVHTANWIVEKCFNGDLVAGRTIILVTHNVALVKPYAQFAVSLGQDGRIASQGSIDDALVHNSSLLNQAALDNELLEKGKEMEKEGKNNDSPAPTDTKSPSSGKLVVEEEVDLGRVGWPSMRLYLRGLAGGHSFVFFPAFITGLFLSSLSSNFQTWYLGQWAAQYDTHRASEVPVFHYLGRYGCILLFALAMYCSSYLLYMLGIIRASRTIHRQLINSVLGTTLRWLDVTPTSRVIARCTQDIRAIDNSVSRALWTLSDLTSLMLVKFGAVVLFTPVFFAPGIALFAFGGWCGRVYMAAQLSIKRDMSNARAPVLGHFGAAMSGLTSIRAYACEPAFITEMQEKINYYTRSARVFYNLNRWVAIRLELLSTLFTTALAVYLVYFQKQEASNAGFSLTMTLGFSGMILVWIRCFNDFEVQSNSLERIQRYLTIEQEPAPTAEGMPPAYWPASGALRVDNLSARYSVDGPEVLHGISFNLEAGEHVGVVGRTGSGKSSLTLALLRAIPTEGNVYYDGIPTASVNLDALRGSITIIPQQPELLAGTLRHNLDFFGAHDDAVLKDALRAAGLGAGDAEGITLDTPIATGGRNLSVGERQIVALARALVRGSKLLILDEGMYAANYQKDAVIQAALRRVSSASANCVITVAHRLQSVVDADKVMVLDAGRIVEFGPPKDLLRDTRGRFRALVDESEDRAALYSAVGPL
ncbi:P-loop containing nucleoside triphosphate hydrolase protein [Mycena rosella]|uniref:P-loop containing nucleoside triphosphate hydrolase protein n=1 Tax=Mycena rosella TaxID=1033263 RepID=A0AAD7M8B0_MYCRO|nr:P-loop containing nucleoside triphosphate hydrolase protein [Mycena rosella]